jgi:hypothetical protein
MLKRNSATHSVILHAPDDAPGETGNRHANCDGPCRE